jgi:DNA-binding FadR family transcriptional regulator
MSRPSVAGVFLPVASPSTFEETVARLGRAIRLGVLEPGARLPPERELADQLGISRSTLRQALSTLTQSGHLTATRGRSGGTFVAQEPPMTATDRKRTPDAWQAMLDRRTAIELGAVQLATERATDEQFEPLAGLILTMRTADDWRSFRRADVDFHLCIAEASGSRWLVQAMTEVHGELSDLLDPIPHPATALEHSTSQHDRILAALNERNAARAVARMREHVRGSEALFEGLHP